MTRSILFATLLFLASCAKEQSDPLSEEARTRKSTGTPTSPTPAPTPTGNVMQYLPKRVGFGVESDISQLSNIPAEVDYRYHYLTGDLFSDNWSNWNSPNGEYARIFLNQTGTANKIPVFTYYMIVAGRWRFQEPAKLNLNDAELMRRYFENWKLLLNICKTYGKPVVIQYEPDLMGYMQNVDGDNPVNSPVAVASSGHTDVTAFANNARGLFQAIKAMRDKYAPNVLLGWHASQWATRMDLIANKANPEDLATKTATYYKALQAPFDLIFSEFSDRDAGYYEVVRGDASHWWSTTATSANGYLSDFDRFQRFLKQLNTETAQKIMLWQIPLGNTLTATCNNTRYHYKDNRPQYFLQSVLQNASKTNIQHYANAGVIALLFGAGEGTCTNYQDAPVDGITAAGEGVDNDGGYLRRGIKAYYAAGPISVQ